MIEPHLFDLRVYTEDTDFAGIVYHANYLKYFERARSEWAEKIGFGSAWQEEHNIYFPIRAAQLDFKRPARLHEMVTVHSTIIKSGAASITYGQDLRPKEQPSTILCQATIKIACVGRDFQLKRFPTTLKTFLQHMIEENNT